VQLFRYTFRAMGSPCEVQFYAPDEARANVAANGAKAEILRLENQYSRYREDSLTTRINHSSGDMGGIEVDDETAALLDYAHTAWQQSAGLFDITSGIFRRAWDFKVQRLPSQEEIDHILPLVGWDRILWQRPRLVLPLEGIEIDFGGYVKEYAADRAALACRLA
jgi:thiamine biosynthesis lipoprotein